MTKSVNLISESDMTDGSAFFITNVNKHSKLLHNGVGIFINVHVEFNQLFGKETAEKLLYLL